MVVEGSGCSVDRLRKTSYPWRALSSTTNTRSHGMVAEDSTEGPSWGYPGLALPRYWSHCVGNCCQKLTNLIEITPRRALRGKGSPFEKNVPARPMYDSVHIAKSLASNVTLISWKVSHHAHFSGGTQLKTRAIWRKIHRLRKTPCPSIAFCTNTRWYGS